MLSSLFSRWSSSLSMETFGIMGFMFGLIAFVMVGKLTKDVKNLQEQMEDMKKRPPPAQDS